MFAHCLAGLCLAPQEGRRSWGHVPSDHTETQHSCLISTKTQKHLCFPLSRLRHVGQTGLGTWGHLVALAYAWSAVEVLIMAAVLRAHSSFFIWMLTHCNGEVMAQVYQEEACVSVS